MPHLLSLPHESRVTSRLRLNAYFAEVRLFQVPEELILNFRVVRLTESSQL